MSNRDGTRVLFDRIWSAGVQAAREGRHRELDYLVHMRPSLEEYQAGRGLRMTHMIKVVQLGMSRLRAVCSTACVSSGWGASSAKTR